MRKDQIASFVEEILNTGATLYAVGEEHYFFGDLDVADGQAEEVIARVNAICERYGPRDHLRPEIASHLNSLGRRIDIDAECQVLRWIGRSERSAAISDDL